MTLEGTIIRVLLALIIVKAVVRRVIRVSSLTESSSAGFTLLGTGPSHAKTGQIAAVVFASSLILQRSFGFCLSRAPEETETETGRVI